MRKLLPLIFLLLCTVGLSQPITVNTTSHSVPQLVNNVLINSPCVEATNVTWRTGTNFGSVNGIGFFQNSNPNFPMQGGVVLSTGNAMNAAGPNSVMLNDGSNAWTGDADLEATLAAAGITMQSTNATVLEFDFTPISSHFNFDFVFASEEYGNFQCQFSDAFAFLLTNMNTGVTTNLAVVPGTNTPISVVTIRDFLYNSSCPSQNAQYFGSYNGGSAAASSASNFNGQTVLLNASSVLTPNTPYHIKLVIADRSDLESDSAIFISSDSFNIGQDVLGLDLTIANNTAICFGETYTLNTGLSAAEYTFSWTRNGVAIAGANGPSINVTQAGNYAVTYTNVIDVCQPVTDVITIEFHPQFTTPNPITLYKCNTGAATYIYDLTINTPVVTEGLPAGTTVSYHASEADAQANANPLNTNHVSAGNQTVWVRIKNPNTPCFTVKSFQLLLTPGATATAIPDVVKCARSLTLLNAIFNLPQLTPQILNGQSPSIYSVSYFTSQANADTNTNPIPGPSFISTGQQIFVRVQLTTDPSCYSIVPVNLIVNPLPPVDDFEDVIVCDSYILPALTHGQYFTGLNGTGDQLFPGDLIGETMMIYIFNQPGGPDTCPNQSNFKVTVIDPLTLSPSSGTFCGSFTLPVLEYGEYHTAPGGGGTVIPAGTSITSSQTVYVYFMTEVEPFCVIDTDFQVTITPTPEVGTFPNVFDCTSYTLPALTLGKYYTEPAGGGTEIPAGTVITSTQTVYVHAQTSTTPVCMDDASFNVYIGFTAPADVTQCDPYTLPVLPIGNYYTGPNGTGSLIAAGTVITTPTTVYIYIPNSDTPDCMADVHFNLVISQPPVDTLPNVTTCGAYTLPALVNGAYFTAPNGGGDPLAAGDVITTDSVIYIYSQFSATCSNQSSFTVTLIAPPAIDSRSDIDVCNSYTLTPLTVGNYYTGPGGTGTMLPAGTVLTESQFVYIYAQTNTTPPCSAENSFELYIFSVEADDPADVVACDSYVLPALTIGEYFANPGGPAANAAPIAAGTVITASTTLYIYTESGERINCSDENVFTITINQTPVIPAIANVTACESYALPALTVGEYYTAPGGGGNKLEVGTVLTQSQTVYVYAETATNPNCTDEASFQVTIFNVDQLPNVTTCDSYVLPALSVGKYYTGPNGTGAMLPAGTALNASQTIYIFGTAPFSPACTDQTSFVVTIVDTPIAYPVPATATMVCDEDGTNDGVTAFDLSGLGASVLGGQTGAEFSVTFHESMEDAQDGTNAVTSTLLATVYARVSNSLAPDCYAVSPVAINVKKLPEPTPIGGIICYDTETQTLISPYAMASGLSSSNHVFQWHNEAGVLVGTSSVYTAVLPGIYTVTATNTQTGCVSEPVSVEVMQSEPAVVTYTISDAFADNQVITVVATGIGGDYEYMLDNGSWQDSPVFENVSSGIHVVTVRDKNGCGTSTTSALVVNYPHFFTPNGDGYNDTWNIKDLDDQASALISIYDRYGKLITQIKPSGNGWDGTMNGQPLPSTDYWFAINYEEAGVAKEFRAHFSMKR